MDAKHKPAALICAGAKALSLLIAWTAYASQSQAQCKFASDSVAKSLTYSFEPFFLDGRLTLRVTAEFRGVRGGTIDVELPSEWAGQTHLERQVGKFHAISRDTTVYDSDRPNVKTIRFPVDQQPRISYELVKDWEGQFEYPKQFRAVLEPTYFEFTTQNALVHPKISPSDMVSVHFDWLKLPADWTLETSFGSDDRCQSFTGSWIQVDNALFAGGDFRVHRATVGNQPLVVAIRGKWGFMDDEAVSQIQKVLAAEREFWHDYNFPYYLVTLKPFEVQGGSSDGSAFTNAFWLYLPRTDTFSYGVQYLLAHESFHAWNPHKMGVMPEPEASEKWFSEGFTVYYADVLLLRSGLLSLPEYIERTDRRIRDYYSSPVRNLSNNEIVARYAEDSVNQLPYVRGPILALWLDSQIRKESRNKVSLDTVMLTLVRQASEQPPLELNSQRVTQVAGKSLSRKSRKMLYGFVQDGVAIPIPDFPKNPCVDLTTEAVSQFDLGFDSDVLRSKNLVSGVRQDSEAFKAGVRDGQQVLGMSIYWGDVTKPVKLTVSSPVGPQRIEYFPKGNTVQIPQYHLVKNVWASTPELCTSSSN